MHPAHFTLSFEMLLYSPLVCSLCSVCVSVGLFSFYDYWSRPCSTAMVQVSRSR